MKVMAVKLAVTEVANPVTQNDDTAGGLQRKVEHDVAMAKNEELNIGMRLQIAFGPNHLKLLILTQIGGQGRAEFALTVVQGPGVSERHGDVGVNPAEKPLADFVAEECTHKTE